MQIVIIGLGSIGKTILRSLSNEGHTVTIIDENKSVIENLIEKYDVISACPDEQINLPTNVFSVNPTTVIADKRNVITNSLLKAHGKQVVELDYSESSKIGGSFRCSTCPLRRD